MTDNSTFLGFDKKQIPILSLTLAGFLMLAGMIYHLNSNINALNANVSALNSRIDALILELAETNARIVNIKRRVENIERNLPDYASIDNRITELEREQARIAELVKALTNAE